MSKKNDKSKGVLAKDYLHIDESIYDGDLFDDILTIKCTSAILRT